MKTSDNTAHTAAIRETIGLSLSLWNVIDKRRRVIGMTWTELEKTTGMSLQSLRSRALAGKASLRRGFKLSSVYAIADALAMTPSELLRDAEEARDVEDQ